MEVIYKDIKIRITTPYGELERKIGVIDKDDFEDFDWKQFIIDMNNTIINSKEK